MATLIVRRGLGSFYFQSLVAFARNRDLWLVIDRRSGDRRCGQRTVAADRRRTDRRAPAPSTWEHADYIVIPDPPADRRSG